MLSEYIKEFPNASDALNDALKNCYADAGKIMTPSGLKSYIQGAVSINSVGKGEELLICYLEKIPGVVKEVGESIIQDIVVTLLKMTSQTSASILVLITESFASVVDRVQNLDLMKAYLSLLERMMALAPRGMRPMLENIEQLINKLTIGGLRRWVLYGAETYRRDFKAQLAYFSLESADSLSVLEKERRGILFVDINRQLQFYLRSFYNREFFLRPTSGDYETKEGLQPFIQDCAIHVPDAYDDYEGVSALDCYRAAISHAAIHIISTKSSFNGEELNSLQKICIGLFEDLRVEMIAIKKFPGLKQLWLSLHPTKEKTNKLAGFTKALVELSKITLSTSTAHTNEIEKLNNEFATKIQLGELKEAKDSFSMALKYYDELSKTTDVFVTSSTMKDLPILYRDNNNYLWDFDISDWSSDEVGYVSQKQKQVRKTVSVMEMVHTLDCELAGDDAQEVWLLETELFDNDGTTFNEQYGREVVPEPIYYHEWDYKMQIYRPHWVTIYPYKQKGRSPEIIDKILEEHRPIANRLKDSIEKMQPQGLVKLKKQPYGNDLDIDECISAAIDIRGGITPSENLYIQTFQHTRSVAIDLLIDLSESTNEVVAGDTKTILQLIQEATAILAWAIGKTGDKLSINGFASDSRHDVQFFNIKDFNEQWSDKTKSKLAGIQGGLSTRMGSAIRHACVGLEKQSVRKKIMFLLTDGQPADIDVSDPQYLRQDTKRAVEEANAKGILVYCISLDPFADRYVSHIFGSNRYTVIDRVEKLPERLPQLFVSLTK